MTYSSTTTLEPVSELASPPQRIVEIDFIKGVLAALMVAFHVDFIGSARDALIATETVVYLLHMPAFLFLSGHLANLTRPLPQQLAAIFRRVVVPYLVFETVYVFALYGAGRIGLRFSNVVLELSARSFLVTLVAEPIGPYWYLHTLAICLVLLATTRYIMRGKTYPVLSVLGAAMLGISYGLAGFDFRNAIYVLLGIWFHMAGIGLPSTLWCVLPGGLVLLVSPSPIIRGSAAAIALVVCVIGTLHAIAAWGMPLGVGRGLRLLGVNAIAVVVFHPFFLNLCGPLRAAFLDVDSSGVAYLLCVTTFALAASIGAAWCLDRMGVGRLLFGRSAFQPLAGSVGGRPSSKMAGA